MFPMPGLPPITPLTHFPAEMPVGAVCSYAGPAAPGPNSGQESEAWQSTPCPAGTSGSAGSCPGAGDPSILESQGWMICDGRDLSAGAYPELYAALGTLYGSKKDGSFKIPDLRGTFLRGVDEGAGVDPDAAKRSCPSGGTGSGVGSMQCDALQTHTHAYSEVKAAVVTEGSKSGAGPGTECAETSPPIKENTVKMGPTGCGGEATRVSSETRPRNVALYFIIKYRSNWGSRAGQAPFPQPPGAGFGYW